MALKEAHYSVVLLRFFENSITFEVLLFLKIIKMFAIFQLPIVILFYFDTFSKNINVLKSWEPPLFDEHKFCNANYQQLHYCTLKANWNADDRILWASFNNQWNHTRCVSRIAFCTGRPLAALMMRREACSLVFFANPITPSSMRSHNVPRSIILAIPWTLRAKFQLNWRAKRL